eukprot:CAMPEP_0114577926 /NCGR_PEP_ID=MMETSP0125-20121206/2538_1 /TAXON_ID=485358 ORGANISM="Aristerostoma sp., Strain ATCC 50986" /NCGR_SAMPLE_ID=MMETSP0125 /ASSEMBLY_ACC=CAM_ASM_000245 /LENGTH=198 /DNA_ID=CAMNT_0001767629 /DNA_START=2078 /DNA_END=2674 /DNA_ORIENTATION=+
MIISTIDTCEVSINCPGGECTKYSPSGNLTFTYAVSEPDGASNIVYSSEWRVGPYTDFDILSSNSIMIYANENLIAYDQIYISVSVYNTVYQCAETISLTFNSDSPNTPAFTLSESNGSSDTQLTLTCEEDGGDSDTPLYYGYFYRVYSAEEDGGFVGINDPDNDRNTASLTATLGDLVHDFTNTTYEFACRVFDKYG